MSKETRLARFQEYENHPWHGKRMAKLTLAEMEECVTFLMNYGDLPKDQFEMTVNRMFLDRPKKPKNWLVMQELLACSNSA